MSSQYLLPAIISIISANPINPIERVPCLNTSYKSLPAIFSHQSLYSLFVGKRLLSLLHVFLKRSINISLTEFAIPIHFDFSKSILSLIFSLLQSRIVSNANRGRLIDILSILPLPIAPISPYKSSTTLVRHPITESLSDGVFLSASQSHKR